MHILSPDSAHPSCSEWAWSLCLEHAQALVGSTGIWMCRLTSQIVHMSLLVFTGHPWHTWVHTQCCFYHLRCVYTASSEASSPVFHHSRCSSDPSVRCSLLCDQHNTRQSEADVLVPKARYFPGSPGGWWGWRSEKVKLACLELQVYTLNFGTTNPLSPK